MKYKSAKILLAIAIIVVSFWLRYNNYDKVPFPGESMDEYSYTWVGISLWKLGVPIGISGIGGYKNEISRYINVDGVYQTTAGGNPLTINWPWFDHPPLLGLITGGFALLKNANSFDEVSISIIRKPMVVMGTLSVIMVMLFCYINFGYMTSIVSGMIYGSMPIVVVGSRMVQGENGVVLACLMALVAFSIFVKSKNSFWLYLAGGFSGIGVLFKLSGIAVILTLVLCLWSMKMRRRIVEYLALSLSIASLFGLYGLVIDRQQFMTTFQSNSHRFYGIGPEALYRLLSQVKVTNLKYLTDPLVLMGWIAMFILFFKRNLNLGDRMLAFCGLSWIVVYLFFGSMAHGWYVFPFYPILAMSLARLWGKSFASDKNQIGIGLLWLMGIGFLVSRMVDINIFQEYVVLWKIVVLVVVGGCLSSKYFRQIELIILFLVLIAGYILYGLQLTTDFWYKVI